MTTVLVLLTVAAAAAVVSFVRVGGALHRVGPGPEREALLNSLWSIAGSTAIILAIAMGLPPLSVPLAPRWAVLGVAFGLVLTGGIKTRRLTVARRRALVRAVASATERADRIDALEGQRAQYRSMPVARAVLIAGKVIAAGTALWALRSVQHPTSIALFATLAVLNLGWLGWDVVSALRRKVARDRIDAEIAVLLSAG